MVKVIFFDAAGTLFEPRDPVGTTYARLARGYGVMASAAEVEAAFRRAFVLAPPLAFGPGRAAEELRRLERQWWRDRVEASFGGLRSFVRFDDYFDELFAYFADPVHWRVDPQAGPTLARLVEAGLALGVVSNFDFRLHRLLEGLDLRRYFTSVTISSEVGYAKPAPEIFRLALAKHGVRAADAMHVGDSAAQDAAGARAAGLRAVLLAPAGAAPPPTSDVTRVNSLSAVVAEAGFGPFP